ncbi:MAG: tetratricopeptide repeat protein [Bdellovibrionia bacterium]
MDQQKFSLWILILTVGLMQWYYVAQKHFGGEAQMKANVEEMRLTLEQEKLQHALARQELREFKQQVAAVIPEIEDEDQDAYSVRNLASIVVNPDFDKIKIEKAATLMERGRAQFRAGNYERSNDIFNTLLVRHPDSIHVVEAYFLTADGRFREGQYEECLKTVDTMVNLFPEHELTGFALIRMGQVLTQRDRIEDAEQIYRTVLENFKGPELTAQASQLLKEITL